MTSEASLGKKMRSFFEGLMRQVMERQEAMQQQFLGVIENREPDTIIREEASQRQYMTQERAMAASNYAAVVFYLQRNSG